MKAPDSHRALVDTKPRVWQGPKGASGDLLRESPFAPILVRLKKKQTKDGCALHYQEPKLCPLSHLGEGVTGRVKRLVATPELNHRLREMGVFEDQRVRLLGRPSNVICQVCNARLAISNELAKDILVEPLPGPKKPSAA
jgi:Fe2+ transport system protein FeoA